MRAPALQPTRPIRPSSTSGSDCSASTARRAATTVPTALFRSATSRSCGVASAGMAPSGIVIVIATTPRAAIQAAGPRSWVRSPPEPCR